MRFRWAKLIAAPGNDLKSLDGCRAMNILFLSQIVPYPPHGGVLQRGYNLIREIGKRNTVHLLAFVHPDVLGTVELLDESRRALGEHCRTIEYFELWPKKSKANRIAGLLWGGVSGLPFSVLAHRSGKFEASMAAVLRREMIDLVHFDTLALGQFGRDTKGIPRVLTHHNIESQLMQRRADTEGNPLAKLYLSQQARKISAYELAECGKFDLNVFVSDTDAASLKSRLPGIRAEVIPNGVDLQYFKLDRTDDVAGRPTLIYTGGMNMFANRDAVLFFLREMWPAIKQGVPEVRFYAVGQDPPAELLRMAEADPSVVVTGFVDDIRPLVAQSAVYVVPLRVGGGTRLKILDAMAMERAIVSTSVGAEGINVTSGKNILLVDEPAEFAAKTLELLRNPDRRSSLGLEARNLVESEYSWDRIGGKLQVAYESVLASKRSHGAAA
jgi:polysaccharide biosynthesis protein PslH